MEISKGVPYSKSGRNSSFYQAFYSPRRIKGLCEWGQVHSVSAFLLWMESPRTITEIIKGFKGGYNFKVVVHPAQD